MTAQRRRRPRIRSGCQTLYILHATSSSSSFFGNEYDIICRYNMRSVSGIIRRWWKACSSCETRGSVPRTAWRPRWTMMYRPYRTSFRARRSNRILPVCTMDTCRPILWSSFLMRPFPSLPDTTCSPSSKLRRVPPTAVCHIIKYCDIIIIWWTYWWNVYYRYAVYDVLGTSYNQKMQKYNQIYRQFLNFCRTRTPNEEAFSNREQHFN